MENMMSDQKFTTGNRVRNAARPEWGVGTVQKAEAVPLNGTGTQRLTVRFPNAGSKVLLTAHARLVLVTDLHDPLSDHDAPTMQGWDKLNGDWLAPMAQRKVDEAMISLPAEVKDPFNSMKHRLGVMLGLYRFSRSGSGLMDWAVAQTGLDDPLSRFTRHELEAKYDRWCHERDNYLAKLLQEARSPGNDSQALQALIKAAPPSAQDTVRKITAWR